MGQVQALMQFVRNSLTKTAAIADRVSRETPQHGKLLRRTPPGVASDVPP